MKVLLLSERKSDHYWRGATPMKSCLPFYERTGDGYVHRVRSAAIHRIGGSHVTHSSYTFWCGASGFIYPAGKQNKKRRPAMLVNEPSIGRVVCATCEARAIGAGQLGSSKIGDHFVKFRPRGDFYPAIREAK